MTPARVSAHPVLGDDRPHPAVLVLPGGGYGKHADHEAEPVAAWLNGLGFHCLILRYRVAPHRFPSALEDAQAAMRQVRAGTTAFSIDPDRVGVIGFSAGGHLAAAVCNGSTAGTRPDFAVLGYPVISFGRNAHQGSVENLLGPDSDPAGRRSQSMESLVSSHTPPTFLWHTANDPSVHVSHSLRYAAALAKAEVPFELHVFPHGRRHGLGLALGEPGVGQWTRLCEDWLTAGGWTRSGSAGQATRCIATPQSAGTAIAKLLSAMERSGQPADGKHNPGS